MQAQLVQEPSVGLSTRLRQQLSVSSWQRELSIVVFLAGLCLLNSPLLWALSLAISLVARLLVATGGTD